MATAMTMASAGHYGASTRYLVASHEATYTLHRSMCLAPYLPGGMVVAIAVESVTSYIIE
jgi:hypothetical protein